jgi:protein-S-isoprenylcysteine O-methyltransferase Ste14
MTYEIAATASLVALLIYVLIFAVTFSTRERSERRRDRSLLVGLSLQALAGAVIPASLRTLGTPLIPSEWAHGEALEQAVRITAVLLQFGSVWMTYAALRTLGKQWSLSARVVEKHQLIRTGPYGLVRHPIYTGVLGLQIGAALAVCNWQGVIAVAVLSALGSAIRVRSEERLMRDTFGAEYDSYARSVPALVPRPRFRRAPASGA